MNILTNGMRYEPVVEKAEIVAAYDAGRAYHRHLWSAAQRTKLADPDMVCLMISKTLGLS